MISFKQILLPTDFSSNAKSAQDYACEFAAQFGARLHLLSVVQDAALVLPETGMFLTVPMPQVHEIVDAADKALHTVLDPAWESQHDVIRKVVVGSPFVEIVRYADENQIDLIILGTHGRTGLGHILMGSVAERVLREAKCPVLTIRSPSQDDETT
jgi:nucleotide-binding universal stress UspA family protein